MSDAEPAESAADSVGEPFTAAPGNDGKPGHRLFAALYDPVTALAEWTIFRKHRRYLADGVTGRVLDLGAGTGASFPALQRASADDPSVAVHAVEPDPHMRRRAERRAADLGLDVTFVAADAGELPYDDGTFDVVIASLVLCTVPSIPAAVDEMARVLAADGELRLFEHVRAGGILGRIQHWLTPAWRRAAAGCHLDRATGDLVVADDRFAVVDYERLTTGVPPVMPFVRGRFRRI